MLCSILSLRAQTFVKPAVKVKDTSFAVITDKGTFQACEAELKAYQEILGMEGLPTFIVYNEWNKPEDVKKVIVKLYKKDKLEGVVFVGDIPIPMLRKAQHMTSAFKMDEKNNDWRDSSVPSDRFYDDFDLQFDFLKQDSVENNFFYYNLAINLHSKFGVTYILHVSKLLITAKNRMRKSAAILKKWWLSTR